MNPKPIAGRLIMGGWRRALVGVVMAATLLPVPAFALTFLGTWTISQTQTGFNVPAAQAIAADTPTGGSLTVDMGLYTGAGRATSEVTATRLFQVSNPSELVTIAQSFSTGLSRTGVVATVTIEPISGTGDLITSELSAKGGGTPQLVTRSATDQATLTGGLYRVVINIRYIKEPDGAWNNISPHRFDFTGV